MIRLLPLLLLVACAPFPDLGDAAPSRGPAPVLLPLDELLAQGDLPVTTEATASVEARAAALRARAAAMQRPVAPAS